MGKTKNHIFRENPLFHLCLGICPALAVTTSCSNALGLGVATAFVLVMSCIIVSALRHFIPKVVRTPCFVVIITTFSSFTEMIMAAYMPNLHKALGIFVPLIAINCVILANVEGVAYKNTVGKTALDSLRMGIGYALALLVLAAIRELFGHGTLLGYPIMPAAFDQIPIFLLPSGGFIVFGLLAGIARAVTAKVRR